MEPVELDKALQDSVRELVAALDEGLRGIFAEHGLELLGISVCTDFTLAGHGPHQEAA